MKMQGVWWLSLVVALSLGVGILLPAEAVINRTAQQYSPIEFELNNVTYSGNPFDLIATATFVHTASGETRTTGMFYAGGTTWKFKFTATRHGMWTFTTASADTDLNGISGTVDVAAAANDAYGFVSNVGNRWARAKGPEGTPSAFVPQFVMYSHMAAIYNNPAEVDADIQTFFVQHGFNGFHVGVSCRWFDLYTDSYDTLSMDPNPDFRTFEALEMLINKAHAAGGVVHIWAWGDQQRHATPVKWGVNGAVDQRLQRYIAARLGPLPNWSMGYGFDLWEWTTEPQLRAWHDYMQEQFGWKHYLGARNFQEDPWTPLSEAMDYSSYEMWRPDYNKYVLMLEDRPHKPSFAEDRFRIRDPSPYPEKDYDEPMTRRGLWHSAMAGGVANIWGNLVNAPDDWSSASYPHPEWIRTNATFFENRYLLSMFRDNTITNGVCLRTPDSRRFLFYREDTNSVSMNLSNMPASAPVFAVDTKLPYQQISVGTLQPGSHNWTAPYTSDWAIAVDGEVVPSAYCFEEPFVYPNSNLNGVGGWSGNATSQIAIVDGTVKITGGAGEMGSLKSVFCVPQDGLITITAQIKAGAGSNTMWGLWIDDPTGKNFARWYGAGTTAKGRIGGTLTVTATRNLSGPETGDNLEVRIDTAADTSQFFFNGVSLGTLSHASQGTGDIIGRIRFDRIDNYTAAGETVYLDNILVGSPDTTPPGLVMSFQAAGSNGQVALTWTNPTDADFAGTMIRYKTDSYPASPTDGVLLYSGPGTSANHFGLANGVKLYYSAFAYDAIPNYSSKVDAVGISAAAVSIAEAKALDDGEIRYLQDKTVTMPLSGYFYVQEPESYQGIKVVSETTVAAGNKVTVTGALAGKNAERYIDATGNPLSKTARGPGIPPPIAMPLRSAGGASLNLYTPGVADDSGPNNVGSYVRVWGKVTQAQNLPVQYVYIDDGSDLMDGTSTGAEQNIGLRVDASPSAYSSGDYLAVAGVISLFNDAGNLLPKIIPAVGGIQKLAP